MRSSGLSTHHIATFALSLQGGAQRPVHTEDVAVECHKLAPDRFSWQKYPAYPDKELVRKALFHASESKNGSLVSGRSGRAQGSKSFDGWQLTANGMKWVESNLKTLEEWFQREVPEMNQEDAQRLLRRLKSHPTFAKFKVGGSIHDASRYDLADLVQSAPDSSSELIRSKLEALVRRAQLTRDPDALAFTRAWEERAAALLR